MKNKKNIIIIILVSLIVILGIILFLRYKKYDVTFELLESDMVIEYGSKYVEPGFVAKNGLGKDISEYVTVDGNVDIMTSGQYKLIYKLNYDDVYKELTRIVTVDKISIDKLDIVLNGNETIYLLKNNEYKDDGAYIVNKINNQVFELGNLTTNNNINNKEVGVYSYNYVYEYNNQTISKTRKIEVFDINYEVSPTTVTTSNVVISFDLNNISNYSNTKLPNNETSLYKDISYNVTKNGEYKFIITLKDNTKYEKVIKINNIVGNYKCNGTINNSGTKITVTGDGDINNFEWIINGKTIKGNSTYQAYKIISNAKVNLILDNNEKYPINCNIKDNLLYHFKYDLENSGTWTKPEISCSTYTATDRTRLEKLLSDVVEEGGGKGSRGGAVAAARFIVGALDYRIRYQAPRQTDASLGKYQKVGLNIGNGKAWGCRVGGYINGLDCTHLIEWILAQVGFKTGPYSYPKSETSKVIDTIKPGDLVYVKCGKSCANQAAGLSHVGIIAGISDDRNIFYIVESVPGSDGKLGVTLHATKKSTVLKAYGLIGKVPYTSEGNYNNMILGE